MEYIPLILLVLGILLLVIEIFVPSFGIWGGLGIIATLASIVMLSDSFVDGIILLLIVTFILSIILTICIKFVAKKNRHLILNETLGEDTKTYEDLQYFIGKEGLTLTALRPAGNADFSGVKLDVMSSGEFIKDGTKIVVTKVEGTKIFVKKIN